MGNIFSDYQAQWETRSTVRSRPRRILKVSEESGYFYPEDRQPLCVHPAVVKLGEDAKKFILIQSLYKYSNDIALIETEIVNRYSLYVVHNQLPFELPLDCRLSALTIIVDEAYHAYVALDCMDQISKITNTPPLPMPQTIELSIAIDKIKQNLSEKYHSLFCLFAISIAENTLTKDIFSMRNEQNTNKFFQHIINDHLIDETRHSGYFYQLSSLLWEKMTIEQQNEIGKILPQFLQFYLTNTLQKQFDTQILSALKFNETQIEQIIHDTHSEYQITESHPMVKNILLLFKKNGILENQATKKAFIDICWLSST